MKSLKVMLGITMSAVGLSSLAIVGTVNNRASVVKTNAATFVYDASAVTTRRIYFINNNKNGTWYQGYELSAQVWYGSNYSGFVNATEIYGNYYYCVDFTSDKAGFLGGDLHFELRAKTGTDTYAYTSTCHNVPALNNKAFDAIYIDNGNPTVGSTIGVGDNITIIKCVMDHYSTCTDSYASGYNGYTQLYKDFVEPNLTEFNKQRSISIDDKDKENNGGYTIGDKLDELQRQYTTKGWTVA